MATRAQLENYARNPNVRKFLDLIAYTEGTQGNGYHTAFGGGRLSGLRDHPRYSKSFKQLNGKTNTTSAAGRYQFLKSTWDGVAKQYGLSDFGPHSQDLGAVALLIGRGALAPLLKGDWQTAVRKSGKEWASLPTAPSSYSQPTKSWAKVNKFMTGKASPAPSGYQEQQTPSFERSPLLSMSDIQARQPQFERSPLLNVADIQGANTQSFERSPLIDLADIQGYDSQPFERPPLLSASDIDGYSGTNEQAAFERSPLVDETEIDNYQQSEPTNLYEPNVWQASR